MFDIADKLRKRLIPNSEDRMVDQLMRDIGHFEVQQWIMSVIEQIAVVNVEGIDGPVLPPDTLEVWRTITPFKQELAFCFLLGAIHALMRPPDSELGAEPYTSPQGEGPGERLSPPGPSRDYATSFN